MYKYTGKLAWTIIDGKKYALGGDVRINRMPPKVSEVIKECTQKEYKFLHKKEVPNIIYEPVQLRVEKQHTGSIERPGEVRKFNKEV